MTIDECLREVRVEVAHGSGKEATCSNNKHSGKFLLKEEKGGTTKQRSDWNRNVTRMTPGPSVKAAEELFLQRALGRLSKMCFLHGRGALFPKANMHM